LKEAGIAVILDHHALPGVATSEQMFAGRWINASQLLLKGILTLSVSDAPATSNFTYVNLPLPSDLFA
jgi:hypothetical protein